MSINWVSLDDPTCPTSPHWSVYVPSTPASIELSSGCRDLCPTKHKIFIIWTFTEKLSQPQPKASQFIGLVNMQMYSSEVEDILSILQKKREKWLFKGHIACVKRSYSYSFILSKSFSTNKCCKYSVGLISIWFAKMSSFHFSVIWIKSNLLRIWYLRVFWVVKSQESNSWRGFSAW